jgi:hypothetical protein
MVIDGDVHDNSLWGMARPGFDAGTPEKPVIVPVTPLRVWQWKCWLDFCNFANKKPINYDVWNGDITDGYSFRTKGIGSWSPDKEDWKRAFMDIRKELVKDAKPITVFVHGTGPHFGYERGLSTEQEISDDVVGSICVPHYEMSLNGFALHIEHSGGSVSLINPESTLQREVRAMERRLRRGEGMKIDLLICNHIHMYREWGDGDVKAIINGCWQGITPYMSTKGGFNVPSIGGLVIDANEDGLLVQERLYKMPMNLISTLNTEEIKEILERRKREDDVVNSFNADPLPPRSENLPLTPRQEYLTP